jgi:hypothetical protein
MQKRKEELFKQNGRKKKMAVETPRLERPDEEEPKTALRQEIIEEEKKVDPPPPSLPPMGVPMKIEEQRKEIQTQEIIDALKTKLDERDESRQMKDEEFKKKLVYGPPPPRGDRPQPFGPTTRDEEKEGRQLEQKAQEAIKAQERADATARAIAELRAERRE